jgi:outer membrane lipoprotein SlyB
MADLNFFAPYVCGHTGSDAERQAYSAALRMSDAQLTEAVAGCPFVLQGAIPEQGGMPVSADPQMAQQLRSCPSWARTIVSCREKNRQIDMVGYAGGLAGAVAGWVAGSRLGHPVMGSLLCSFIGYAGGRFYQWPKGGGW